MPNEVSLAELIYSIDDLKILLPNFQRKFVWTDVDKQKKLVASVITRLPIGTLLLFRGKKSDFANRIIGFKKYLSINEDDDDVEFLLDGQQRLTVLSTVFSNIIFDKISNPTYGLNWGDLHNSLKVRFFIKLPKYDDPIGCDKDIFGFSSFQFPFNRRLYPNFSSSDAFECIATETFKKEDVHLCYHPNFRLNTTANRLVLEDFCIKNSYIPLYLMIDRREQNIQIVKNIIQKLAQKRAEFLTRQYDNDEIAADDVFASANLIVDNIEDFRIQINTISNAWFDSFCDYLNKTIEDIGLNLVSISRSDMHRAIDIYENINMGGLTLSVFELVIAKHSKMLVNAPNRNQQNLMQLIVNELKEYSIPNKVLSILNIQCDSTIRWTASELIEPLDKNDEINSKIESTFLNLLSIISLVKVGNIDISMLTTQSIKKEQVLKLSPEIIDQVAQNCIRAIIRALAFIQVRCGVRKVSDINYDLMLLPISYFLYDEDNLNNVVFNKLEYWYWHSIFSGVYDKDQNENVIKDLKSLHALIDNNVMDARLSNEVDVFNILYFSDKNTLLMKNVDADRYPKTVMYNTILQYMISKGLYELYTNSRLFSWNKHNLEKHHILPIAGVANIGESVRMLREDSSNIINSPANFTYLTSETNKKISDREPDRYRDNISAEAKVTNFINANFINCDISNENQIENVISDRLDTIIIQIKTHLANLKQSIQNNVIVNANV